MMMATKKFSELSNGQQFTFNSIDYIKIPEERISCCSVLNAVQANDRSIKIQITPITEVEIAE
jgi:hypothetical protein